MIARIFALVIAYVVPAGTLFGGVMGLWISIGYLREGLASSNWPQVEATIIRSELGSETDPGHGEDRTRYWPEVEFRFALDESVYQSSHVTLDGLRSGGGVGTGRAAAEAVLARYPVGASVDVYYDPDTPERAVLQPGISSRNFFVPVLCVVLSLVGAFWLGGVLLSPVGHNRRWQGKQRVCPRCQTAFTSVQDKGTCPGCRHTFYASQAMHDQPLG